MKNTLNSMLGLDEDDVLPVSFKSPKPSKTDSKEGTLPLSSSKKLKKLKQEAHDPDGVLSVSFSGEICGGFRRDESRAQGEDSSGSDDGLSHGQYRAVVMKTATKLSGGKKPETKHMFAAKKMVDRQLGKAGVGIYIPGAKPGRRTI